MFHSFYDRWWAFCLVIAVGVFGNTHKLFAHGTPILVGATGGAIEVSGGYADSVGFASQIFFEDDEDGEPFGEFSVPGVGPIILWQIPGYYISGLSNAASLSIEAMTRPVVDTNPIEQRLVWYWNPVTEEVSRSPADFHLLGSGQRSMTLLTDSEEAPPAFLMASSLIGQQNSHNHGLLNYGLDNDSARPAGAYGFFARLTSNEYGASDPFLVVFNYGVDYELMTTAALAINAAAVESESLPGDFNFDGMVNAADYVVWRKAGMPREDYGIWKMNYGRTAGDGSGTSTTVPEPNTLLTAAIACVFAMRLKRRSAARVRS